MNIYKELFNSFINLENYSINLSWFKYLRILKLYKASIQKINYKIIVNAILNINFICFK